MASLRDELPWESISAQVLEELIYSLVGEMGAVEREWRSSPGAINTADGGRDVEAVFMYPTAEGEFIHRRWWIDAKRRSKSVSPADVKEVAYNSIAWTEVDSVIIASNNSFSNATKDWVKQFNSLGRGPTLRLWDRVKLQELVNRYPGAAAATFFEALEPGDRIEYLASYFFDRGRILTEDDLAWSWDISHDIFNTNLLLAATYSEMVIGDISKRPWGAFLEVNSALRALILSHSALLITVTRNGTISWDVGLEVAAYITAQACRIVPAKVIAEVLSKPFFFTEGRGESPPRNYFTEPVLGRILGELLDVCADDCARVTLYTPAIFKAAENKDYWARYQVPTVDTGADKECVASEIYDVPCVVGFNLDRENPCPLLAAKVEDYENVADAVRRVIEYRAKHPSGGYEKHADLALTLLAGSPEKRAEFMKVEYEE